MNRTFLWIGLALLSGCAPSPLATDADWIPPRALANVPAYRPPVDPPGDGAASARLAEPPSGEITLIDAWRLALLLHPALAVDAYSVREAEARQEAQPELRLVSFDLETQRSAEEVGGWHNAHLMRMACAVVWDSAEREFFTYREHQVEALLEKLAQADLVIGFNAHRFDYRVLRGYAPRDLSQLPTFDLLDAIHERLGFRLPLGHLGEETLGIPKSADGLQSLQWFKEGRHDEIARYCQQDVAILRDLFEHACRHGHLLFRAKNGERVRLPLRLSLAEIVDRERKKDARRRLH